MKFPPGEREDAWRFWIKNSRGDVAESHPTTQQKFVLFRGLQSNPIPSRYLSYPDPHAFEKMLAACITLNQITIIRVLDVCSHARLVEERLGYYHMMNEAFKIKPQRKSWRAREGILYFGWLEQAVVDAGIWGALLGACRVYRNPNRGETVARKLVTI
ncbi:hypothetical protein MLD38_028960 [Melastoma candidum]|uniref:Uncharacterized protein n=1 Tax=Melastoma candidum TaxID=119954 RepID=A0ACB9N2B8_9MYRT|nr:hypothetical protein MLD38_028960 [Melastoma candidum]